MRIAAFKSPSTQVNSTSDHRTTRTTDIIGRQLRGQRQLLKRQALVGLKPIKEVEQDCIGRLRSFDLDTSNMFGCGQDILHFDVHLLVFQDGIADQVNRILGTFHQAARVNL